ncbi:MAG: nuclear transport factor 2 family protein, partial [Desulfobacterales bacterium]|nr:nuclear transport factor 2 family protein [Desulfobacterales bacterium]
EERLKHIEDRQALQDVLYAYCKAVDKMTDLDAVMGFFTQDAVFDVTGIGLPRFKGHDAIRGFFAQVFGNMTHHGLYITNFAIDKLDDGEAFCSNYTIGNGRSKEGHIIQAFLKYSIHLVLTPSGWKMTSFVQDPVMPIPEAI